MLTFRSRILNLRRRLQPGFLSAEEQSFLNGEGTSAKDPVTLAVLSGRRRGNARHRASYAVTLRARELFEKARRGVDPEQSLEALLQLIREYPNEDRLQILAARLLEAGRYAGSADTWTRLVERMPSSEAVIAENMRRTIRNFGHQRAYQLLNHHFPIEPKSSDALLLYVRLLEDLRDYELVDEAVERLLALSDLKDKHILGAATLCRRRGEIIRARDIARRGRAIFGPSDRLDSLLRELEGEVAKLSMLLPRLDFDGPFIGNILQFAIEQAGAARAEVKDLPESFIGPVVLINGSLAAGGAERQFANTAIGLALAMRDGTRIGGLNVVGPVRVICKFLQERPGAEFFLHELHAAGIDVDQYTDFADYGGRPKHSAALAVDPLLPYLPAIIAEATRKLTDVLVALSPQVVHIWQDGMILATALAALVARVPRIVLAVRTMPPIDRPERNRPEYEYLYKTLLRMPGVRLEANSRMAARRYMEWLQLDEDKIGVIYNGVAPLSMEPDDGARQLLLERNWQFEAEDFVVGSVMRFDENKRPYLWIEVAHALLEREPGARFILVGEGPLWESSKELVDRLGLSDRFLFTGRSHAVGFWISCMSALLLLSRHEGMPNVLIEAQSLGVPVVSTPAGGAAETFSEETGCLLPSAQTVDPAHVTQALLRWKLDPAARSEVSGKAKALCQSRFSLNAMIEATVRAYHE
jgi:glycosyltransferase involved in cell wall biosynthesis